MSGIYIKGMEMPTSCCDCRFMDEIDCTCIALNDGSTACFHGKPDWCPLTELPPHGRLIDADALIKLLDNCMFPSDMVTTRAVSTARNWIIDAPTIIESEE